MHTISNISQKIFNIFTSEAQRLGKETQYQKRASKITPDAFIRALITTCLSGDFRLEQFCDIFYQQGIVVTKQSLHERLNERTVAFIKELCSFFLNQFQSEKLPQIKGLELFTSVNIIDSSTVSLHQALSKLFKGSGGAASTASLKIQLTFDLLAGQIKELTLTPGSANDQSFTQYFQVIQKGALYLIDLGYFKLTTFANLIKEGAFFVSRLLTGTQLFTLEGEPLDLLATLSSSGPLFSQKVLMGSRAKIPVRLVAQRLSEEIANKRRQKLKKGHKRRGITPSKGSLALQSWSIYITNTNEEQIEALKVHQIYALRWQIELIFKLSKSLMQIDVIRTTKPSRVLIETYAKFMTMMIFFFICEPARYQEGKELSWFKACKLLINRITDVGKALKSTYRLNRFIESFYGALQRFAVKDIKKKSPGQPLLLAGEGF
jgi:hypothetical protein